VLGEEPEYVRYLATLGQHGPPAALKLIDPTPLHDAGYLRRLKRATRRWKRVDHPNLARLVKAGKSPAGPYVATSFFAGPTLAAELAAGALPPARAGAVALEIASALDAVLDAGVRPAALSPRDVVMTATGALVTDPGVGRCRKLDWLTEALDGVHYLSPEEALGDPPLPQSAVYSLACVVHESLTGLPPYAYDLPRVVLYAHLAEPPARPRNLADTLPAAVDDVFERAMAADPDERHPSPGAFARELAGALGLAAGPPA
jgi:serine/threonine protein kinase